MRDLSGMFDLSVDPRLQYAASGPFKKILQIGSGWSTFHAKDGEFEVVNSDQKPGEEIDRVFDITGRWDVKDNEFDLVVAFHIIEHIPIEKVLLVLLEARRALRAGGVLLLEFPDFKGLCEEYLKGNPGIIECIYGHDRYAGDQHRWGYTGPDLVALLHTAGFSRTVVGPGKCYHAKQQPALRVEAVHYGSENWTIRMQEPPDGS